MVPKFYGEGDDAWGWQIAMEKYFQEKKIKEEDEQLAETLNGLRGCAFYWYIRWKLHNPNTKLWDFTKAFVSEYLPEICLVEEEEESKEETENEDAAAAEEEEIGRQVEEEDEVRSGTNKEMRKQWQQPRTKAGAAAQGAQAIGFAAHRRRSPTKTGCWPDVLDQGQPKETEDEDRGGEEEEDTEEGAEEIQKEKTEEEGGGGGEEEEDTEA